MADRYLNINDKILIDNLQKHKRWSWRKLFKKFLSKGWSRSGLNSLLKQIDARGNADRAAGSGRPRSARTSVNIAKVEELVCSQEREPQAWHTTARTSIQWLCCVRGFAAASFSWTKIWIRRRTEASLVGLPPIPDFPGCPGFAPCCPASRQDQPRDAKCPGFQQQMTTAIIITITIIGVIVLI